MTKSVLTLLKNLCVPREYLEDVYERIPRENLEEIDEEENTKRES